MRARGDVRVREHVAVGREDDARAGARRPAARRAPDAHDGRADLLDDVHDGARVRVEELFVLGVGLRRVDGGASLAGPARRDGGGRGLGLVEHERNLGHGSISSAHALACVKDRGCAARELATQRCGSSRMKRVPRPSWLSTRIAPPWPSTMLLTIDSPSPVPFLSPFVVKNGAKTCARCSRRDARPVVLDRRPTTVRAPRSSQHDVVDDEAPVGRRGRLAGVGDQVDEHLHELLAHARGP